MSDLGLDDKGKYYKLPDPTTGKIREFVRTSDAIEPEDKKDLINWSIGVAGRQVAADAELANQFRRTKDKKLLKALSDKAFEEGGGNASSRAGTFLHTLTEKVDRGDLRLTDVPAAQEADVRAYVYALGDAGVTILPDFIERTVLNQKLAMEVAGTLDRIVRMPDGRILVGDLKSGQNLYFSQLKIAAQIAVYANADFLFDPDSETYSPMPEELDRTTGLVIHLPAGRGACALYEIDLVTGWRAAQMAAELKSLQVRRNLMWPHRPIPLKLLIERATTPDELEQLWRDNRGRWTPDNTDAATARMAVVRNAAA